MDKMTTDSNSKYLQLNFLSNYSNQPEPQLQVVPNFTLSPCYSDIIYVWKNLQDPPRLSKTRARSVKLKAAKFCVMNQYLYWKDPCGILINCLLENEAQHTMKEFHQGGYGGHHAWKVTTNKVLRVRFYWPSMFSDVFKETTTCHQCWNFEGKRKLVPLPLNPILVEAPFQQWGLDLIGEINPNSSGQHRWTLTSTNYFTKWI